MKIILTNLLIFFFAFLNGQESNVDYSEDWRKNELINIDISKKIEDEISDYDLSSLWITNNDFPRNGVIGSNYQRIQIFISSVIKDIDNPLRYLCNGKSKVNDNICDFSGEILIQDINQYRKVYSLDDTLKNAIGGSIIADFIFYENKTQKYTGIFKGVVVTYWYMDTLKNKIYYNELETFSDSYENNTFVGTWTSYTSPKPKLCIWGDYRLPYTNGLYIGAGDILIGSDYVDNGWKEFTTMWTERENSKNKKDKWWR